MNLLLANIKNLRELTGAGFLDCKNALNAGALSSAKGILGVKEILEGPQVINGQKSGSLIFQSKNYKLYNIIKVLFS